MARVPAGAVPLALSAGSLPPVLFVPRAPDSAPRRTATSGRPSLAPPAKQAPPFLVVAVEETVGITRRFIGLIFSSRFSHSRHRVRSGIDNRVGRAAVPTREAVPGAGEPLHYSDSGRSASRRRGRRWPYCWYSGERDRDPLHDAAQVLRRSVVHQRCQRGRS